VYPSFSSDEHYLSGAPGAWTRDETLTHGAALTRIAYASSGDVYASRYTDQSGHLSFDVELSRRIDATTWSSAYAHTTSAPAGGCVYPISLQPLALPGGDVMLFEEGMSKGGVRWLRAHRPTPGGWVMEDVADLSWLSSSCSANSASYTNLRTAITLDALGRPHVLFPSAPDGDSQALEDHYRDANGWHVRSIPLTAGAPFDMLVDATGTTHIIASASAGDHGRIVYLRVAAGAW
jgi:hypothetical protein